MHPKVLHAKQKLHKAYIEYTRIQQKAFRATTLKEKFEIYKKLRIALNKFNDAQQEYLKTKRQYPKTHKK